MKNLTIAQLNELPYLEAVIKESLRFYGPTTSLYINFNLFFI